MDELDGVARDAETLLDVLSEFGGQGWSGQFAAGAGGTIECATCHHTVAGQDTPVLELRRLEGASDPDDMLAVVAIECPDCARRGSLVLNYGPTATQDDADVLVAIGDPAKMNLAEPDEVDAVDAAATLQLEGDIDVASAGVIGDEICALIESGEDPVVVLCDAVSFVESRGLAMMARVQRVADDAGCRLVWRALPLPVLRTLHLCGLDRYLRIEA